MYTNHENLEVGHFLEAIDPCIMEDTDHRTLTVGELYEVLHISDDQFMVIDDDGDEHYFDIRRDECFKDGNCEVTEPTTLLEKYEMLLSNLEKRYSFENNIRNWTALNELDAKAEVYKEIISDLKLSKF